MSNETSYGLHSVITLLKVAPERVLVIYALDSRNDQRLQKIFSIAERSNVTVKKVSKSTLDEMCDGRHQGVVAEVAPGKLFEEEDLYKLIDEDPSNVLILVLDGVTDPHNLGACLRTADATGVSAVIVPKDNSVGITDVSRKVACGAAETVPLIVVTNLARAISQLKERGVWVTGTAGEAEKNHYEADLSCPRAIVMGAEGKGLRRLTREHCDELVKIPMMGSVSSLNVSVATGVILFEVLRQKT